MESDLVDMSQMKAMILKDGNEIGRTDVARDGAFTFNNIAPGCYGLVAAGNQGVAAVAFCVIKPDSVASKRSRDGKFFVATAVGSLQDSASPSLNVMLADGADVMAVQNAPGEEIVEEEIVEGAPFALAPMGGQAGAGQVIGGGGGGIGSGLGDLVPLAGLGIIGALLASELDDDNATNNNAPVVSSPVTHSIAVFGRNGKLATSLLDCRFRMLRYLLLVAILLRIGAGFWWQHQADIGQEVFSLRR